MPKIAKAMKAIEVSRLKDDGFHFVGNVSGLALKIDNGARSWVLRTMVDGKRKNLGLGPYPEVGLASAISKASAIKESVRQGQGNSVLENTRSGRVKAAREKAARETTFIEAARQCIAAKSSEWSNPKHKTQWENTLAQYAFPVIGEMYVRDIGREHVMRVLNPIWLTKNETASRLRGRIEAVLSWSKVMGYRTGDNPAEWKGNLDATLSKPGKVQKVESHPALQWCDIGAFMQMVRSKDCMSSKALEFLILTVARSNEVREARWKEINWERKSWEVPASRMKAKRAHNVPLCDSALLLLQSMPRFADTDLIFPNGKNMPLSSSVFTSTLKNSGYCDKDGKLITAHGFRSTFRDWVAEATNYSGDIAEKALAHGVEDATEAAYFRSDLFNKRRRLMTEWGAFTSKIYTPDTSATIIPLLASA